MGVRVAVGADEREALTHHAEVLGVVRPLDGAWLRRNWGRCVFLDAAHSCRLHARFGPQAKPAVCRQYPWVAVRVDGTLRVGVDPGCTAWPGVGDPPPAELLEVTLQVPDPAAEARLLDAGLCDDEAALAWLGVGRDALLARARAVASLPWAAILEGPDPGPFVRTHLLGLEQVAWPRESLASAAVSGSIRMVYLRLAPHLPPDTVLALGLVGACLAGSSADVDLGARRLAAWFRLVRLEPLAHLITTRSVQG